MGAGGHYRAPSPSPSNHQLPSPWLPLEPPPPLRPVAVAQAPRTLLVSTSQRSVWDQEGDGGVVEQKGFAEGVPEETASGFQVARPRSTSRRRRQLQPPPGGAPVGAPTGASRGALRAPG